MRVAINHGIAQEFFRLLPEGSRDIEALRQGLSGFWLVGFGQGEGQVIVLGCSAQPLGDLGVVVELKPLGAVEK